MISANAAMMGSYDYGEVARSILIAIAASYAALDLAGRVSAASSRSRAAWLTGGAIAMGTGIWAMHFKGMLALHLPVSVEYHLPTVLASLLAAILASAAALNVVSRRKMGPVQAWTGSLIMGGGIATMHYVGVAAMRLAAVTRFDPLLVALSIVLAIGFSFAALLLAFGLREENNGTILRRIGSAVAMGVAISAMHYTGMAATSFMPSAVHPDLSHAVSVSPLGSYGIGIVTFLILGAAILTSSVDRRTEAELRRINEGLDQRVVERTGQLAAANQELRREIAERQRAEDALRRSEDHLRLVIDSIPQQIWSGPPDGSLDFCNAQWRSYTGLTQEELQGEGWRRMLHPDDRERVLKAWRDSVMNGTPYEQEERHRGIDGTYRWYLARGVPLRDAGARIVRWYGTNTDIEDRKRAEDSLQKALEKINNLKDQLYEENVALREEIDIAKMFEEIVGSSPALQAVLSRVSKVAPTESTVLITGETGTGKELIARAIHKQSQRSSQAFVSVSCAAIPRDLIASELFGHEKGAFTGATHQRPGRFELAEGGTVFLDEVGELPAETQIALLRVLQEREFERVGGNRLIHADVRVIAATNRNLQTAIATGEFRSDLFYRLNVFPIEIPPLRERKEDIPMLVEYFIDRYASKAGKKIRGISKKTLELLESYTWPGNIRELQNVIERSVILCDSDTLSVDETWLSQQPAQTDLSSRPLSEKLAAQEKEMIEAALAESKGRVSGSSGAASKLGIPQSTLDSKIKSLKINKLRFRTN